MSCDEIRYWIREIITNPDWGWKGRGTAIATVLGIHTGRSANSHLRRKLDPDCWIYPGEQIRFTKGLRRILAGEVKVVEGRCPRGRARTWNVVVVDNPVPLPRPRRLRYNLATGRLEHVTDPLESRPSIPSFKDALRNAPVWGNF
jgi:hypothetical protein